MNLDKLFEWITIMVIGFALTGNLDKLTHGSYNDQTKLIYESRERLHSSINYKTPVDYENSFNKCA